MPEAMDSVHVQSPIIEILRWDVKQYAINQY